MTVTWEFAQRSGQLVFDPLDLAATAVGAAAATALYVSLQRLSFRPTA